MRLLPRALLAGGLGLAASLLVACGGGSGLLSGDQASSLNSQLDHISSAVSAGDCAGATNAISAFSSKVAGLSGVNPTLRDNLAQDAIKVGDLAAKDCRNGAATTATTTTNTTPTNTTTTTRSTTSPTSTETQPTSPDTAPATTPANPGTSTGAGSGGAGIGGGNDGGGASGGTGAGNGNGQ